MVNFVLVPGAWLGGWAWKRVVPLLEERGHSATPVTLTGMGERVHLASKDVGMETAVMDVMNLIKYEGLDDLVLVGHSFAAKVAASVADRFEGDVRKVVYVASFRPEKTRKPQMSSNPAGECGPLPPGGFAFPFTEKIVRALGPDVQGADHRWMMSMATPWPAKLASDPITLSEHYDSIECAHIFCNRDGDPIDDIVAGKWGKLEGPYRRMDTGHFPMITSPAELAENLISLSG